ncbi:hypothetical protein F5144DRAFT_556552 [Chaetomium tenue]|uniref:Uncharacterized protein n=1 Tax=Chaetomium tenue TaxID=1854479 RepID=A0ACB7PSZ7_9PEZI|nr:hypothetical protein F5144DRAFT_556552 [Chaetomium globosum]
MSVAPHARHHGVHPVANQLSEIRRDQAVAGAGLPVNRHHLGATTATNGPQTARRGPATSNPTEPSFLQSTRAHFRPNTECAQA